jgi:hypothetical protein
VALDIFASTARPASSRGRMGEVFEDERAASMHEG